MKIMHILTWMPAIALVLFCVPFVAVGFLTCLVWLSVKAGWNLLHSQLGA
jgi:ABC-type proline/glycine betaine transport system permease subunit